jgi:hypothetical protein
MGVGLAGRLTYTAAGRLDGIVSFAIGDIVSSAMTSSIRVAKPFERHAALIDNYRQRFGLMQVRP